MEYPIECKLPYPAIFDSHAHLDDKAFDEDREALIEEMKNSGVAGIITCGCDIESSKRALSLAHKYDFIYAAVGIHPEEIQKGDSLDEIEVLAQDKKCVAIGEIGLDYYYDKEHKNLQKEIFSSQIDLAKKLHLPIIVHDREAHEDTLIILKNKKPKGVLHCFSGSVEMAKEVMKLGMYLGVGGVITFKNARKLPEVVKIIPDDKLLIETDCPYLAPVPYRGKVCFSGMIPLTAKKIAEIRETDTESVLQLTKENATRLFNI
ncbi:MAG: TatD family hydrolase [Clostridia bacterium]|nr:TatD family hydrolase [Clostridia bacterium]